MDIVKLQTRSRSGSGKSYTHKARVQGWIPAVYYGHNRTTKIVEVEGADFVKLVRSKKTRHLIDLGLEEEKGDSIAIIKEVQRDILDRDLVLHIDFQHVAMDEKVTVKVSVELVGIPVGVKDQAGVLGNPAKFLNIECMPVNIPEKISVDVSALKIGDSIHVRDIVVPDAVIKDSPDEVVAVVIFASVEEEKPKEAAVAAEGAEGAPVAEGAAGGEAKKDTGGAGAAAKPAKDAKDAAKGSKDAKGGKDAKKG